MARARYEFKYRIEEARASTLRAIAAFHLEPDPHRGDTGSDYVVNSLYFDTPFWDDARETWEGLLSRQKVRLRCYSETPQPPYFLELKSRFGQSVSKTRAAVTQGDADLLVRGDTPSARDRALELAVVREVIDQREMTPRAWVKYRREAWVSPWGDGARLTFDRRLEVQAVRDNDPLNTGVDWHFPESDDSVILELKFDVAAPSWMQRLTRDHGLRRVSCSKYSLGASAFMRDRREAHRPESRW